MSHLQCVGQNSQCSRNALATDWDRMEVEGIERGE